MSEQITEQEYRKLKQSVEDARNESARAQGALDSILTRLKEDYGCSDLNAAKTKLADLRKKADRASQEFEGAMKAYQEKWEC